jgi:GDPmannose 4,6-dehydratase
MSWCEKHDVSPDQLINCKEEVYIAGRTSREQGFQFPKLRLGNLDARRDWGHAEDYVRAMWLMMQEDIPDDYVVATGHTRSIKEFLDAAFDLVDISDWSRYVVIDPEFYRPAEVDYLLGSPLKANTVLDWKPEVTFVQLVQRMVESDTNETKLQRSSLQGV